MIYGGTEIQLNNNSTVKAILNTLKDKKHYFYIIQLPECGSKRIKIGKSELLQKRFSEYANLFYGSDIKVLRLITFPQKYYTNENKTGYPIALFESLMKQKLKKVQGKTNVVGSEIQTEWYDYTHKNDVLAMFDMLKESSSTDEEHTQRKSKRNMDTLKVGDRIEVKWNLENSRKKAYYTGKVVKVNTDTFKIKYDEDNSVMTHAKTTPWRFAE